MSGRLLQNLLPTKESLRNAILSADWVMFGKSWCPFCQKWKKSMLDENKEYHYVDLDKIESGNLIQTYLLNITGQRTVPYIFTHGSFLGGFSEFSSLQEKNQLDLFFNNSKIITELKQTKEHKFDYDLAVIGGGSGGLACARKAAALGQKVVLYDFVKPSPTGTKWGIGGTCVNVGCVPKKLFHQSSIVGEHISNSSSYGWSVEKKTHDWHKLVESVQNHVRSLNFNYRSNLRKEKVTYLNAFAKILDQHTIKSVNTKNQEATTTAKFIVVATGERPSYLNIEGDKECCITSDDLFSLKYSPGKTLVIGASYVALECAGFLNGLGYDTTVMVRSIFLRGFDQEMANKIGDHMERHGVKFLRKSTPVKFAKKQPIDLENGKPGLVEVTYKSDGVVKTEEFNTVLLAIGRDSCARSIGLQELGINLDSKHKVIGIGGTEMTEIPNIFAIGDNLADKPQLTPMAIQAGNLLSKRLFSDYTFDRCDYKNVPTTVFTPLEYGSIGYSEEEAIKLFGDDVNVYHNYMHYLESTVIENENPNDYYAKIITRISQNDKLIGFHVIGPNAGEITQGFAIGFRLGATMKDMSSIVGIHPTCAEVFTTMTVSKRSGADLDASGC